MIERKPLLDGGNFVIDFLTSSLEGFSAQTRRSLLRHAPNAPLPGGKEIRLIRDLEQKKFRVGPGFAPKVGIRNPEQVGSVLSFDIQPVTYPTYRAISNNTDSEEALGISNPSATAAILLTTEEDGSHRVLVQLRSPHNRHYAETIGASVAGLFDGQLDRDSANRGRLRPVDTNAIKANALKEMKEEIQLDATDISWLHIVGLARDKVKIHSEFLLLGLLRLSTDQIAQKAGDKFTASSNDEDDFIEEFVVVSATLEGIETLVTQVKCPLPPTHAAAFIAAGYWMLLRDTHLAAASQWASRLEPHVQENYRKIDHIVDTYFKKISGKRSEALRGFDPDHSPASQGLPDAISELMRVGLLRREQHKD
jgi:8-oxo-dGTP pyrophosphatase MutT (NUDIX family)